MEKPAKGLIGAAGARDDTRPAANGVDIGNFRDAMSRLGAAVNIVTTAGSGGTAGFTCSAVCSVSDDPPSVLFCLNRASRLAPVFRANKVFCVNILGAEHETLSDSFAGLTDTDMEKRFDMDRWETLATGSPVLASAIGSLDCAITQIEEVATHSVVFGTVRALSIGEQKPALLYHQRGYRTL